MLAFGVTLQLQLWIPSPRKDHYEQRIFEFESDGFIPPVFLTNFLREIVECSQITNWSILKLQRFFKKVKSRQVQRQKPPTPHRRRYFLYHYEPPMSPLHNVPSSNQRIFDTSEAAFQNIWILSQLKTIIKKHPPNSKDLLAAARTARQQHIDWAGYTGATALSVLGTVTNGEKLKEIQLFGLEKDWQKIR